MTSKALRIGIVGDFDRNKHSHWATEAALFHAAARQSRAVIPHWIETPLLADGAELLADFDGIFGAPGSPYRSMQGMLRALEFARERRIPFLGTCGGFQYALIEFTRNVLGLEDADTAENASNAENVVITPVANPMADRAAGAPLLCGADVARPVLGSTLERLCGPGEFTGEYFCSFETNDAFVERWQKAGLRSAAVGTAGEMRAFELVGHPFFVATLFQPQLSSRFERPHPIIEGYLRAIDTRLP